jgi:hypothetical protein
MPSKSNVLSSQLKQSAVYWANAKAGAEGGRTFDTPSEILVRWEQKQELFIDANAREVRSSAVVFVDIDMKEGEYLYLGTLADLGAETDPMKIDEAYEIRAVESIPDIKAEKFVRRVFL